MRWVWPRVPKMCWVEVTRSGTPLHRIWMGETRWKWGHCRIRVQFTFGWRVSSWSPKMHWWSWRPLGPSCLVSPGVRDVVDAVVGSQIVGRSLRCVCTTWMRRCGGGGVVGDISCLRLHCCGSPRYVGRGDDVWDSPALRLGVVDAVVDSGM